MVSLSVLIWSFRPPISLNPTFPGSEEQIEINSYAKTITLVKHVEHQWVNFSWEDSHNGEGRHIQRYSCSYIQNMNYSVVMVY